MANDDSNGNGNGDDNGDDDEDDDANGNGDRNTDADADTNADDRDADGNADNCDANGNDDSNDNDDNGNDGNSNSNGNGNDNGNCNDNADADDNDDVGNENEDQKKVSGSTTGSESAKNLESRLSESSPKMLNDQANTSVKQLAKKDDLKIADAIHFTETRLNAERAPTLQKLCEEAGIVTKKSFIKKAVLVQLLMDLKNDQTK